MNTSQTNDVSGSFSSTGSDPSSPDEPVIIEFEIKQLKPFISEEEAKAISPEAAVQGVEIDEAEIDAEIDKQLMDENFRTLSSV